MTLNSIPCENCVTFAICSTQLNQAKQISHNDVIDCLGIIYRKCDIIREYLQTHYADMTPSGIQIDLKPLVEYMIRGEYEIPSEYAVC